MSGNPVRQSGITVTESGWRSTGILIVSAVWPGTAQIGRSIPRLGRGRRCQIIEGHLLPDHVHMGIAIPPKYPVASVIGFLKGKSAIAMARLCGKERNFTGEHFWARGYTVSTVGVELEQVRKYIREQESTDGSSGSF